ncbi:DNA replication protein [Cronobacter sakazakii]|nr:DNA replication protein [Cronobacter sakazakii]
MSNVLAFRQRQHVEAQPSFKGYALLHRKIKDLPFYKQDSEAVHLWLHFILTANHQPTVVATDFGDLLVKRGQFISGRNTLAAETGIASDRVKYLIGKFTRMGMISVQTNRKFSLVTVEKYDEYQPNFVPTECQQSANWNPQPARASGEVVPTECQQSATNNKYNNTLVSKDTKGASAAENQGQKKTSINCEQVVDAYHRILPEAQGIRSLTDKRRNLIRTFWKKASAVTRQLDGHPFGLKDWEDYLTYVAQNCRWMLEDRADARSGKTWRRKKFEYFLSVDVYVQIREGGCDDL